MAKIVSINPAIGTPVGCIAMVCVATFTVLFVAPIDPMGSVLFSFTLFILGLL